MMALVLAMRKANFTGKADTDKLVAAFETLNVPQGPDFPDGQLIMNKDDHQGRTTYYLLKINGQKEEVVQTFPADQLPLIGDCKIHSGARRTEPPPSRLSRTRCARVEQCGAYRLSLRMTYASWRTCG